jgi:glycosyltransferase involved in cell wall biosynthesis
LQALSNIKNSHPDLLQGVSVEIAGGVISNSDKTYLESLKNFCQSAGLEGIVRFLGFLKSEKVPDYVAQLDLMVLPYRENGSGAASGPFMWARTFGIPVLASNSRNFADEIRDNVDGMLFDSNNGPRTIENHLLAFLKNPSLRERLQQGAHDSSADHSWRASASSLVGLIKQRR